MRCVEGAARGGLHVGVAPQRLQRGPAEKGAVKSGAECAERHRARSLREICTVGAEMGEGAPDRSSGGGGNSWRQLRRRCCWRRRFLLARPTRRQSPEGRACCYNTSCTLPQVSHISCIFFKSFGGSCQQKGTARAGPTGRAGRRQQQPRGFIKVASEGEAYELE